MLNSTSLFLQTLMYVVNQSAIYDEQNAYNYYYTDMNKVINATKCYGSYGCFELSPPWISKHRPISLFPEDISKIEPNFLFFSRTNPTDYVIIDLNDFDFVRTNNIDPHIPLYTITHGFLEGGDQNWIKHITKELLTRENCNVIVIDWHGGSEPPYSQAVANIRLVGAITAHLLADLARHTGEKKLTHVHSIGHSLGAHLCAYIGFTLQQDFNLKLGRITGLDPAEPHFAQAQAPVRLDRSAAYYVDVIHSDATAFIRGGLGLVESVGHVDYYPNGGNNQPGCDRSVMQSISLQSGSFFKGVRSFLGCNHIRSYELFSESINSKCSFTSIACNSYEDFQNGTCFECDKNGQHCLAFGFQGRSHYDRLVKNKVIRPDQNLVQYLMTGADKPFCRTHYRITVNVSNSNESKRHGGEIGQLIFKVHSTRDAKGTHSGELLLSEGGYHGPGMQIRAVVPGHAISHLKTVEVEWRYTSSVLNPLTWRLVKTPRIHVFSVRVDNLETKQSVTVCPKDEEIVSGVVQKMMSSYC
ncbi:hypothetical protein RN001_011444 [Aquatica leii]|uniref:Lipase domain-containing protein n=1 Tax=Aquatica leii TaxID=1421715 RepID=A0AAN7P2C1_9COLE|nr:hypothetical protein RN001_011444 [Aquatica leii]